MRDSVSVVMFEGSDPRSRVEEMITAVRQASLLDNLEKMRMVPEVGSVYLYTNRAELVRDAENAGARVELNSTAPAGFHFGRALQKAVRENNLTRVFCLNGAGCPLISPSELSMICRTLLTRENFVYTNNTQSADIAAFTVTDGFAGLELPAMDNSLALTLRDELGLEMELMPHSLGLLFDIDTPSDLLVLGSGPFCGMKTRAALDCLNLDYTRLEQAKQVLGNEYRDVALVGRVGAPVIARLNAILKLRLRIFSEERGMKSLGRIASREVVSLLGMLIEHSGLEKFFSYLEKVAECAFIDSRVLMYHFGCYLSDQERYLSDLGLWQEIENPWLQEFTRLASECGIPVILGGHSLVSGSLWALTCELNPDERESWRSC